MDCCEIHKNGKYKHWSCGKYNPSKRHLIYVSHKGTCIICGNECSQFNNRCKKCYSKEQSKLYKGRKLPEKWIKNILIGQKKYYDRTGRKSDLIKLFKRTKEYKLWRNIIFERDNYTCQKCEKRGGKLDPHHIEAISDIIKNNNIKTVEDALKCKKLLDTKNGITLCHDCHKETETYGWKRWNNSSKECWNK